MLGCISKDALVKSLRLLKKQREVSKVALERSYLKRTRVGNPSRTQIKG
jgi:hypothetical protein